MSQHTYNILGYFKHSGIKWILIGVNGNHLVGIDITPLGKIHTLHILKESVHEFVLIDNNE